MTEIVWENKKWRFCRKWDVIGIFEMLFREKHHYSFIWRQNSPYKCDYYSVNWCFDKVSWSNFTGVGIWLKNCSLWRLFCIKTAQNDVFSLNYVKLCWNISHFRHKLRLKKISDNLGHNMWHFCRISAKKCKPQVNGSCFNCLKSYQL